MNKLNKSLLFFCCFAATAIFGQGKPTLGVASAVTGNNIKNGTMKSSVRVGLKDTVESLESNLEAFFQQSGLFVLVERKRLKDLRLEQDLNASGLVEKAQAKKYRLAGAKYIVFPKIEAFDSVVDVHKFKLIDRRDENRTVFMTVSAKIVDASTGAIFRSTPAVKVELEQQDVQLRTTQKVLAGKMWFETGKEAASKLVKRITEIVRPAKVLAVNGSQILINRGSIGGFNVGELVACYAVESVFDEDTGEEFFNEIPVGKAVVDRGDERKCFALIKGENLGVNKGCIVRLVNDENK